jgi:DNA anti-recombination protein RmuC
MTKRDLEKRLDSMTIEEMFKLRQAVQDLLSERLTTRKTEIERILKALNQRSVDGKPARRRSA